MDTQEYAASLAAVITNAQRLHTADPAKPSLEWFVPQFIPGRIAENEPLFTYARTLGYELGDASAPVPATRRVPKRLFTVLSPQDIKNRPAPRWLIRNLLVEGMVSILYAQSRSFKSYLTVNIAGQLATGGAFFPDEPVRQMGVLNLVLEGGYSMKTRIAAWELYHGKEVPFSHYKQIEDWQDLTGAAEVDNLIDNIRLLVDDGFPLGMIIVDTAAKALGGKNTMEHVDALAFCASCFRIQREFGCSVLVVHHTGKDQDRGIIGSNGWFTEPDCVIKVSRPGEFEPNVLLVVEKQKGFADGQTHKLVAKPVNLGVTRRERPAAMSCWCPTPARRHKAPRHMTSTWKCGARS